MAYSDNVDEIFVEPPDPHELTDEDSADDDVSGTLDNLSGSQLRAGATIKIQNSATDQDDNDANDTNNLETVKENEGTPKVPILEKIKSVKDKINWIDSCRPS